MDQLKELVAFKLKEATAILEQDLCLGIDNILSYQASNLVDNQDVASPG